MHARRATDQSFHVPEIIHISLSLLVALEEERDLLLQGGAGAMSSATVREVTEGSPRFKAANEEWRPRVAAALRLPNRSGDSPMGGQRTPRCLEPVAVPP
jgi:hypothetical protein